MLVFGNGIFGSSKRGSAHLLPLVLVLGAGAGCSEEGDNGASSDSSSGQSLVTGGAVGSGGGANTNGGVTKGSTGATNTTGSGAGGGQGSGAGSTGGTVGATSGGGDSGTSGGGSGGDSGNPLTNPDDGPAAGNPSGDCAIPEEARLEDTSNPDRVVGDGSPASCTGEAFIAAVAEGGIITFDCGPEPLTITLDRPAKVFNDADDEVVIDGGGLITLSGGGKTRILYMNTCDSEQVWTTDHCDNQDHPRLTVQNITFVDGNSKAEAKGDEERDGGGAIWARGGRFKAINTRFFNNVCADIGPDVGGAGIRLFSQYQGLPAYIVNSTFGGAEGFGNVCSNGGGISSIGVSWTILNSVFSHNRAVGNGGNPAEKGTPGGGSGGGIYNDGQTMTLSICGTRIEHNEVNAYGSAIFFVSNNHDGTLEIKDSTVRDNTGGGWNVLPGISMHEDTVQIIENSTIE